MHTEPEQKLNVKLRAFELSIRDGAFYQQLCVERTTAGLEGASCLASSKSMLQFAV